MEAPFPDSGSSRGDGAASAVRRLRHGTGQPPVFINGSVLRHILVMTGAGAIGLMAIFAGELANIYFLSRLGDQVVVAAVGYASSILFVATSIGIGLSIAATSLVSPALGASRRSRARRLSAHAHVLSFTATAALSIILWGLSPWFLSLMGATGRTLDLAWTFLWIVLPTSPLLSLGMTSAAVLRSEGDAARAMHITLSSAVITFVFDIVFIVYLGWGIVGAAFATVTARIGLAAIGLYGVIVIHQLMSRPKLGTLVNDARDFGRVAVPAVLTNVATPASNAYVTYAMAAFGDSAVAGWAIIGRVIPVAFGAIFALSSSVGPVIGQNYGAQQADRMRQTLTASLMTVAAFTLAAWMLLAILATPLADAFHAEGEARDLIIYFCRWVAPLFVFLGFLFVANATFNTLGKPHYSTALNWGRATLGTVPFVVVGAGIAGSFGVLAGSLAGGIVFSFVGVVLAYRLIGQLDQRMAAEIGQRSH